MDQNIETYFSDRYGVKDKLRSKQLDEFHLLDISLQAYEILNLLSKQDLSILQTLRTNRNVNIFDHQILAALKIKNEFGGSGLLADEVGLGKTIEAGIILKEYLTSGLIKNALILTPPSLVSQWQDELISKFDVDFVKQFDDPRYVDCSSHDLLIMSHASAIQPKNMELLNSRMWDMIIVDEAHSMKNSETQKHNLVKNLAKRYLLLLSATPIQNNLVELYNLIDLIHPGLLGSIKEFRDKYTLQKDSRTLNPFLKDDLQKTLSRVIIRTTRNEVRKYIQFTDRIPKTRILQQSESERILYEKATSFIRNLYSKGHNLLSLMILQRLISSSSEATKIAIYNMKESGSISSDEYDELKSLTNQIKLDSKMIELLRIIENDKSTKFLIFTEFYATQDYIVNKIKEKGYTVTTFNGKMSHIEKSESVTLFKNECQIMVSTGAGGEGQNFQFCNNIVNYDLPWNPMRVEQRVGRVHRIGQTKNVMIYNFAMENTIESYILELLYMKIHLFTMAIGDMDLLFEDGTDENTQSLWFTEYLKCQSEEEAKNKFTALGEDWKNRKDHLGKAVTDFNKQVFENFNLSILDQK